MFNRKKLALFLFAFLMVIGIAMPSVETKAAGELAAGDIKIDYAEEVIDISTSTDLGVVYVTDKYDSSKPTKAKWETYALKADGSQYVATIDFDAFTKKTADSVVYVKGDTTVYPIQINRQDKSFTATFSGFNSVIPKKMTSAVTLDATNSVTATDCGYIYFTKLTGNVTTLAPLTVIQWKKGTTGDWKSISNLNLTWYTNKGTSLSFRIAPSSVVGIGTLTEGVYVNTGARASKEVKITYKKRDNAPTVKVDGSRYTINLKKGQEYKVGTDGQWINVSAAHGDPAKNGKVGTITLYDLFKSFTSDTVNTLYSYSSDAASTIYIRTAATSSKITSKTTTVALEATLDAAAVAKLDDADATNDLLTAAYTKPYDKLSGVGFTNSTKYTYQVAVVDKNLVYESSALNQEKVITSSSNREFTWYTVKAGTFNNADTLLKVGTGKIPSNKYEDIAEADRIIIYRIATIADNNKTEVNEFRVASITKQLTMPTATVQALTFTDEASVVSTDATTKVVTVTLTASSETITKELAVTLSNPSVTTGVTPKIACVSDATSTAGTVTAPTGVRLLANGVLKADSGKMKVNISPSGKSSTSYWRVTAEGATTYVKLVVTAPDAGTISTALLEKGTTTGKMKITATAGTGNTLSYKLGTTQVTGIKVGETVSGATSFSSGKEIAVTAGQYITIYELNSGKVVNFYSAQITADMIAP